MIILLLIWNAAAHEPAPPRKRTWVARICSALVIDAPMPYAEESNEDLLRMYRHSRRDRDKLLKEAVFRLRVGMFDASESAEFWVITNERKAKP